MFTGVDVQVRLGSPSLLLALTAGANSPLIRITLLLFSSAGLSVFIFCHVILLKKFQ